jgi:adenosylcobinamide kinase / adenosylcobinamide-phosphate guanylyltransferase
VARVSLILGGARSGKSARALALARPPRVFVATAQALDDEMAERIARHRAEREGDWTVAEAPLDLLGALRAHAGDGVCLLADCLTLWLTNLMMAERDLEAEGDALAAALPGLPGKVILVSNEIGMGLAPMNAMGRAFRDAQGRLNQKIAVAADRVEFVAAGLPLVLKG